MSPERVWAERLIQKERDHQSFSPAMWPGGTLFDALNLSCRVATSAAKLPGSFLHADRVKRGHGSINAASREFMTGTLVSMIVGAELLLESLYPGDCSED